MTQMLQQLEAVPIDRSTIHQRHLNLEGKSRSNLMPWKGQFSPELVQHILNAYARKGCHVVDPFMGSGTSLVESARLGLPATGADINPSAFTMARTYQFANLEISDRRSHLRDAETLLNAIVPSPHAPLFDGASREERCRVRSELLAAIEQSSGHPVGWLLEALFILLDLRNDSDRSCEIWSAWSRLAECVKRLPLSTAPIRALNTDARTLPLECGSAHLIVTSPPYINVFNYHQQYRGSAELLGWNVLATARSEFGANRKHRANRFLTVIQYCLDLASAIAEMKRVLHSKGRVILVVGRQSMVRKTPFYNGAIVARIACHACGMHLTARQERVFKNRFGVDIYEDILHLVHGGQSNNASPRAIAEQVLSEAVPHAPADSAPDLRDALDCLQNVKPSPTYAPSHQNEVTHATS